MMILPSLLGPPQAVRPRARARDRTRAVTFFTIVPLTIAAAPYVARIVEISLREMDRGVIEAAQAMGCSPWQIACVRLD